MINNVSQEMKTRTKQPTFAILHLRSYGTNYQHPKHIGHYIIFEIRMKKVKHTESKNGLDKMNPLGVVRLQQCS